MPLYDTALKTMYQKLFRIFVIHIAFFLRDPSLTTEVYTRKVFETSIYTNRERERAWKIRERLSFREIINDIYIHIIYVSLWCIHVTL